MMGSVNDNIITLLNIYYFRSDSINFLGVSVRSPIWLYNYRNETFRHHQTGAEMSGQLGTSAGTGTELSRPPANIFATIGRTEVRLLLSKRTSDLHKNTPYTAED